MNSLRKFLVIVLLVLPWACTPTPESPVLVATNDWIGYRPLYLAQELNYLDGRKVRLLELTSSSEVLRKLRNGVIHAAALTLDEALLLKQDGFDIKIIMVMDVSHGADAVIAQPEFADLKALRGKTIGVEKSAAGAYLLSRAWETSGLSVRDFNIMFLEFGEHENMFVSGRVDAVVTFEPVRSRLLNQGARAVFDSSLIPGEIIDVLVMRSDCLPRHAANIRALLAAWFKTAEYMQKYPQETLQYLAPLSGLSAPDYQKAAASIRFPSYRENLAMMGSGEHPLHATARRLQAGMLSGNLMTGAVELDAVFDRSFLETLAP